MINLNYPELIKAAFANACEKGFHDCKTCKGEKYNNKLSNYIPLSNPEMCPDCAGTRIDPNISPRHFRALIVSELSEALEAFRKCDTKERRAKELIITHECKSKEKIFELFEKNTVEDEIADVYIRIFDYCGYIQHTQGDKVSIEINTSCGYTFEQYDDMAAMLDEIKETCYKYYTLYDSYHKIIRYTVTLYALNALCEHLNIDIAKHITAKMTYNKTRERKHGKRF